MRAPPLAAEADERALLFQCDLHAAHETFARHRTHRAAHEGEFERRYDDGQRMDAALHHDNGIVFAGVAFCIDQAVAVFFLVFEFQGIDRQHFRADLETAFAIQQPIQTGTRGDAMMMVALGADAVVLLQVGVIQHRLAGRAFVPQTIRHALLGICALAALDLGR